MTLTTISESFLTQTLATKRAPKGMARGAAKDYLSDVSCSDVTPTDSEVNPDVISMTFRRYWQVFCEPADILIGDYVIVGSVTYGVQDSRPWPKISPKFMQLILEEA